jgi:pimeloyl-ACP methyl ester carboxylesterase
MVRLISCLMIAALAVTAQAQDYEREKRWADEVVPGLVVGDAVWLDGSGGKKFLGLFTQPAQSRAAVLLVHGVGVHPDHGIMGTLRSSLADSGYATLSVQMPVLSPEASPRDYQSVFPDAVARITSAASWLQKGGAGKVILLSHSMGSSMSNAYYEQTTNAAFSAWVCMGLSGSFGTMRNVKVPVLDVFGEKDLPSVLRADWRRRITVDSLPGSRQVIIAGADHFYAGREKQLVAAIEDFIRDRVTK